MLRIAKGPKALFIDHTQGVVEAEPVVPEFVFSRISDLQFEHVRHGGPLALAVLL